MEEYLESILQNKTINLVNIHLGNKLSNAVFKQSEFSRETFLEIFKNSQIKQNKVNYYQAGNKVRINDTYFKKVQIEDSDIIKNNVFDINGNYDSLVLLYNQSSIKSHEFPCKMEYSVEGEMDVISVDYIEQIKIKLINEKYLQIDLIKDAYADNTIRELNNVLNILSPIFS